jgi:hypothetical protein
MNYQVHFDLHHWSGRRREEALREAKRSRLGERLREDRRGRASRSTALLRRARCCVGQSLQGSPSPYAGR